MLLCNLKTHAPHRSEDRSSSGFRRHARPIQNAGLMLTLEVQPDSVRLSVSDGGSATLPTLLHPPDLALSGRGLTIVRTLTREWGVCEGVDGNTVFGVLAFA